MILLTISTMRFPGPVKTLKKWNASEESRLRLLKPNHSVCPAHHVYDLGFSFFSFQRAIRPTPETLTTVWRG